MSGIDFLDNKIIEVCNAGFANEALSKSIDVAMFMPCKIVVADIDGQRKITLSRPEAISEMMSGIGLDELASSVETTLKKVITESV